MSAAAPRVLRDASLGARLATPTCLHRADDGRDGPQHPTGAAASAVRRSGGRRKRAAVTSQLVRTARTGFSFASTRRPVHAQLAFEALRCSRHQRLAAEHAGVVDQVARCEIVGAVDHNIEIFHESHGVVRAKSAQRNRSFRVRNQKQTRSRGVQEVTIQPPLLFFFRGVDGSFAPHPDGTLRVISAARGLHRGLSNAAMLPVRVTHCG